MPFSDKQDLKSNDLLKLRDYIRWGKTPDTPNLLRQYLLIKPSTNESIQSQRKHYIGQFQLLIDTIADDYVPGHWRCTCLDQIYLPLQALQQLADCTNSQNQVAELYRELRIISHYFQDSMTHNPNYI